MNRILPRRIWPILVVLFALATLSACHSPRRILKTPLRSADENFLLGNMAGAEIKFDTYSAKASVSLINEKSRKTELKAQIRIKKDSLIWISFSPLLGIEAARLVLSTDSIKFINRLDKTYFTGDYAFIRSFFGTNVDYDMVQALLTGNDFNQYENENFRASVDRQEYRLTATHRMKKRREARQKETPTVLVQSIWLNPESFKIVRIDLREYNDENKKLSALYDDFVTVNGQRIPMMLFFDLWNAGKKTKVKIQVSKAELDEEQQFPFKIPENYAKLK